MHTLAAAILFAISTQAVPFSLEHFGLDVNVDYQKERVSGVAQLTIRNISNGCRRPLRASEKGTAWVEIVCIQYECFRKLDVAVTIATASCDCAPRATRRGEFHRLALAE